MEGDFSSRKRPRLGVVDKSTDLSGPSASPSLDTNRRAGDHISAYPDTVNKSAGSGDHFPGASFSGPVYLGKNGRFVDSIVATHQATQAQRSHQSTHDCWRSLAFLGMDSRLHDIEAEATGTCRWISRHHVYTCWASCDRALLWIKGKPGSGKSTLLRYILNDVAATRGIGNDALILPFFFHGRGTEMQRTPLGLFRPLLAAHCVTAWVDRAATGHDSEGKRG